MALSDITTQTTQRQVKIEHSSRRCFRTTAGSGERPEIRRRAQRVLSCYVSERCKAAMESDGLMQSIGQLSMPMAACAQTLRFPLLPLHEPGNCCPPLSLHVSRRLACAPPCSPRAWSHPRQRRHLCGAFRSSQPPMLLPRSTARDKQGTLSAAAAACDRGLPLEQRCAAASCARCEPRVHRLAHRSRSSAPRTPEAAGARLPRAYI